MVGAIRWLAPVIAAVMTLVGVILEGEFASRWVVVGLALWMLLWWIFEAVPLAVTALLPLILLPSTGVLSVDDLAGAYANPVVFLFLGGFLLAAAVASSGLHQRLASFALRIARDDPAWQVGAILISAAFLSMWISNTATVALLLPVVTAIAATTVLREQAGRSVPGRILDERLLLLGLAAAANIGGMATLIGTPPNAVLAGYLSRQMGMEVGFLEWMVLALPVSVTLLLITWGWVLWSMQRQIGMVWLSSAGASQGMDLSKTAAQRDAGATSPAADGSAPPSSVVLGAARGDDQRRSTTRLETKPWSSAERRVAFVFVLTVLAWITRPWMNGLGLSGIGDAQIALVAAVILFVLPAGQSTQRMTQPTSADFGSKNSKRYAVNARLLDWRDTRDLPWGVLLLIGGGIALGSAIERVGLTEVIILSVLPAIDGSTLLWIGAMSVFAIVLSHFVSNTAAAALLVPIVAAAVGSVAADELLRFALPVVLAASCAFLLPTATPPNAIVFSTGRIRVGDMIRFGLPLSVAALAVIGVRVLLL